MKTNLLIVALFYILFTTAQSPTQKKINDLRSLILTEISDSLKIKSYGDLCWYYGNISIDSAFYYGNLALNLSIKTADKAGEAQAYNDIGILHYKLAEYDKAILLYKKSLPIRKSQKDTLGMASLYNKLGIAYHRKSVFDSALYFDNKALLIYKNKKHLKYANLIQSNIANIYNDLRQYNLALRSNLEVAKVQEQISDSIGLARSYNNIGNSYLFLYDTIKSLNYYRKAIDISKKNNYERELGAAYNNYGTVLQNQKKFKDALIYINKSLAIKKEMNDNRGIASGILNVALLNIQTRNLEPVEKQLRTGLEISINSGIDKLTLNGYSSFLTYFALKKNADSVIKYQQLYMATQDLLLNERITKEVAEIQEKYNTVEREKEISLQKEELLEQELEIKNKTLFTIILGSGFLILSLITFGIYAYQTNKRKQLRTQLALKDELAKTKTQNKLQEQRLRISRDLHDNIGSQLTFIISSIDNLKFITKAADQKLIKKLTEINTFAATTIAQLRDTIWAMNKDTISYLDFESRILSFIEKAKLASTTINFEVTNTIKTEGDFHSAAGINLFRILQEAVNNAIKYAHASQISITLSENSETIEIKVQDNGKGFDFNKITRGNGLENMQYRVDQLHGKLTIESTATKGTLINVILKKTNN